MSRGMGHGFKKEIHSWRLAGLLQEERLQGRGRNAGEIEKAPGALL